MPTAKRVTTIPATLNRYTSEAFTKAKKRRAAGYARVSTDHEDQQNSYEAQVDYYTNYIKNRDDLEFVEVYADEGITGCNTKARDGFNRMIEDALAGRIDLIITKSVSRFARNTVDTLTTIRLLKEHGVEVYFEKEVIWTFDSKGELFLTIMSSLAQEESRSISENCIWGQRKRFADGKATVPFGRFLGYDRGPKGELVLNPEEAVIVRKIYGLFLQGNSPYTIAHMLTKEGIPTPAKKDKWHGSTVKSILTNEKYKGDALLQKCYTSDFLTKKKKVNHGEIPQYYVEGDHEAIIRPEVFDQVQKLMETRVNGTNRNSCGHVFSGMVKCGRCGSWYGPKVWHSTDQYRKIIWRCNHKYKGEGENDCDTPILTEDELKEAFLKAASIICSEKDEVFATYEMIRDSMFDTSALEAKRIEAEAEMNVTAKMVEDCVTENARIAQNQDEYAKRYSGLVERVEQAKSRLESLQLEITGKQAAKGMMEQFLETLESTEMPTVFDNDMWFNMVNYATVYARDDIRFTFKNGMEIKA